MIVIPFLPSEIVFSKKIKSCRLTQNLRTQYIATQFFKNQIEELYLSKSVTKYTELINFR